MGEQLSEEAARQIARTYADEECVGELGEIEELHREENVWHVVYTTHTFSDAYTHEIHINPVGNVFGHDRRP